MLLKQIKNHQFEVIGEIHQTETGRIYNTTRNNHLKQVYAHKTLFVSDNGKETYEGQNCIGISLDICKILLANDVATIYFKILNFPKIGEHFIGKISVVDFLSKSITIQEKWQDKQRITAMENLERTYSESFIKEEPLAIEEVVR